MPFLCTVQRRKLCDLYESLRIELRVRAAREICKAGCRFPTTETLKMEFFRLHCYLSVIFTF